MFNIQNSPMYDQDAVQPMRDELVYVGFKELKNVEDVDAELKNENGETALAFINSVCGCAAGSARPAVALALQHSTIPDKLITAFAGQEKEAVQYLRENYLDDFQPSSPFIALMKNGRPIYAIPRFKIEGRYAEDIAEELTAVFEKFCENQGPSISKENYEKLVHAKSCGSKIPLNKE